MTKNTKQNRKGDFINDHIQILIYTYHFCAMINDKVS